MYGKPVSVPILKEGKLIDTVSGVVVFWNWAAHFIHNLRAGRGVRINTTVPDSPVIEVDPAEVRVYTQGSGIVFTDNADGSTAISAVYV